jgi:peroxiredoxin
VNWDKEADAKRFVEQYRLPFPVGRDADGWIGSLYGMEATPTSVFIAKDGKLVERHEGGLEEADFERRISSLLTN